MAVVEEFVNAVKDKWPHCLIQFEDFNTDRAFAILDKFRDKALCFNDDIQVKAFSFQDILYHNSSNLEATIHGL